MTIKTYDPDLLISRLASSVKTNAKPIAFLFGSALTKPRSRFEPGVPGVLEFVDLVKSRFYGAEREKLESQLRHLPPGEQYQTALDFLKGARSHDELLALVRIAVLRALHRYPPLKKVAKLTDSDAEALEQDLDRWHISPALQCISDLYREHEKSFSPYILTTNFDPLIEVALRRSKVAAETVSISRNLTPGILLNHEPVKVVHIHGFWRRSYTLHTGPQISHLRAELKGFLEHMIRKNILVVVGYAGWGDVFMEALKAAQLDLDPAEGAEVLWAFYQQESDVADQNSAMLHQLQPVHTGAIDFYHSVDCHDVLCKLREKLRHATTPAPIIERLYIESGTKPEIGEHAKEIAEVVLGEDFPDLPTPGQVSVRGWWITESDALLSFSSRDPQGECLYIYGTSVPYYKDSSSQEPTPTTGANQISSSIFLYRAHPFSSKFKSHSFREILAADHPDSTLSEPICSGLADAFLRLTRAQEKSEPFDYLSPEEIATYYEARGPELTAEILDIDEESLTLDIAPGSLDGHEAAAWTLLRNGRRLLLTANTVISKKPPLIGLRSERALRNKIARLYANTLHAPIARLRLAGKGLPRHRDDLLREVFRIGATFDTADRPAWRNFPRPTLSQMPTGPAHGDLDVDCCLVRQYRESRKPAFETLKVSFLGKTSTDRLHPMLKDHASFEASLWSSLEIRSDALQDAVLEFFLKLLPASQFGYLREVSPDTDLGLAAKAIMTVRELAAERYKDASVDNSWWEDYSQLLYRELVVSALASTIRRTTYILLEYLSALIYPNEVTDGETKPSDRRAVGK